MKIMANFLLQMTLKKKLRVQYILIEHHELVSMFAKSFLNGQSLNVLRGGSLDYHGLTF